MSDTEDKQIVDLEPNEWSSERPKPYEPFFGSGWLDALVYVGGFIITSMIVRYFTR
jgi:hypothetical protein